MPGTFEQDKDQMNYGRLSVDKALILPSSNSDAAIALPSGSLSYNADLDEVQYKSGDGTIKTIGGGAKWTARAYSIPEGIDASDNLLELAADSNVKALWIEDRDLTVNGDIDFGGKTIKLENGSKIIGTGTLTNVLIEASFDVAIFGSSLTVTGLLNTSISPAWFGAVADYAGAKTDNLPIILKALDASDLPVIEFPSTKGLTAKYWFSDTLILEKDCRFLAQGQINGVPTTQFVFPVNTTCIICKYTPDNYQSIIDIENITPTQESTGSPDTTKHAIEVHTLVNFKNVRPQNVSGAGFRIRGNTGENSNADRSVFDNCEANEATYGWWIDGNDSNIIHYNNCSAINCRRWGLYSNGLLGSIEQQFHLSANGRHPDVLVTYGGNVYQAINDIGVTNLNKNPASETAYWRITTSTAVGAAAWDSGKEYFSGGTFCFRNVNARELLLNPYCEPGQPEGIMSSAGIVIGGLTGTGFTGGVHLFAFSDVLNVMASGFDFSGDPSIFSGKIHMPTAIDGYGAPLRLDSTSSTDVQIEFKAGGITYGYIGGNFRGLSFQDQDGIEKFLLGQDGNIKIVTAPATSAGSYDILTRNSSTGDVEKISSIKLPRTLATFYADASNTGSSEEDLYTYTVPANTLESNGEQVIADFSGNASASSWTLKAYFAGTEVFTFAHTDAITTYSNVWRVTIKVIRASSSTARVVVDYTSEEGATWHYTALTSKDFTTTNIIKITTQGSSAGTVTAQVGTIEFKPTT